MCKMTARPFTATLYSLLHPDHDNVQHAKLAAAHWDTLMPVMHNIQHRSMVSQLSILQPNMSV